MEVKILDRVKFINAMKEQLTINPKSVALVAVDIHQGHLDLEIAPMVVEEDDRKRVLENSKRLIEIVRKCGIPVNHVIFQLRPIENERRTHSVRQLGVSSRTLSRKNAVGRARSR